MCEFGIQLFTGDPGSSSKIIHCRLNLLVTYLDIELGHSLHLQNLVNELFAGGIGQLLLNFWRNFCADSHCEHADALAYIVKRDRLVIYKRCNAFQLKNVRLLRSVLRNAECAGSSEQNSG